MPRSIFSTDASRRGRGVSHFQTMRTRARPSKLLQIGCPRYFGSVLSLLHVLTMYPSLKRRLSHQNTKARHANLMCGFAPSGIGSRVCCRTHNSSTTLYGMHAGCQNLMGNRHHGSSFTMNHGLGHGFGTYKYTPSVGSKFLKPADISIHSQASQMEPNQLCFSFMQTSQNCPPLAPRRDTLSLLGVQTFQLNCGMEMALEEGVLLVGSQLYACTDYNFSLGLNQ